LLAVHHGDQLQKRLFDEKCVGPHEVESVKSAQIWRVINYTGLARQWNSRSHFSYDVVYRREIGNNVRRENAVVVFGKHKMIYFVSWLRHYSVSNDAASKVVSCSLTIWWLAYVVVFDGADYLVLISDEKISIRYLTKKYTRIRARLMNNSPHVLW
jgi:hypothetical protein